MASIPSSYVSPGVYIGERIVPGSVATTSDRSMCLVGIAPRTRRASNEAVIRGKVYGEALSSWAGSTPYIATLARVCNRDRSQAVLYKNGNAMGYGQWEFLPASITGKTAATIDSTNLYRLTLSLDGKKPVSIDLTTKGAGTAIATVASEFQTKLNLTATYPAATYGSVFSVSSNKLVITSPTSGAASSVCLYLSPLLTAETYVDHDASTSLFTTIPTSTSIVQADTIAWIYDAYYTSGATYTIDYIALQDKITPANIWKDPLEFATSDTPLSEIVSVGSYPGVGEYVINTDYEKNSNDIDWLLSGSAQANLLSLAETFDTTGGANILKISINGSSSVCTVTMTSGAARTNEQCIQEINNAFATDSNYGPEYGWVAVPAATSTKVNLVVPDYLPTFTVSRGKNSSVTLHTGSTASHVMFDILTASLPYTAYGVGAKPSFGSTYYATYDFTRDTDDYAEPYRMYSSADLLDFTSPLTSSNYTSNSLAIAGILAFENGASSLWVQLVNDSTDPGVPTLAQVKTAIDNCALKSTITDLVVLDPFEEDSGGGFATLDELNAYIMSHVANQSSMLNKNYRRAWIGMPEDTDIGDPDTDGTFVYTATRVLQPGSDSPARGRLVLLAPATISRTVTLSDSTEIDVDLDSSYLAAAVAALFTSLPNVSDAMVNRTITGFKASTFETYNRAETYTLAGNGTCVVTYDAGSLKLLDPITTEAGGGKVVQFEEPQSSSQKDAVTRAVEAVLDANVVGIVPDDLAGFLTTIRGWIGSALRSLINNGSIAPFRDANGFTRDVDLVSDIKVSQSTSDPRSYIFQYWFNLKYPGKRFFGEYSVDNPFFAL